MKSRGFTIVELLIVIVVIAILAAISVVAYNGIKNRANDSRRASDIAGILNALEAYKITNGQYPIATSSSGNSGWHESSRDTNGTFMEYLVPNYFSKTPIDPVNDSTSYWRYYRYSAGSYGCPTAKGAFYTFEAYGFSSVANKPKSDDPLVCSQTWGSGTGANSTTYFKYRFENE